MRLLTALAVSALLFTASTPAHALWDRSPSGTPVCPADGDQHRPVALADGSGGAFVVWVDVRTGSYDIYANRVNLAGQPLWGANGVPVCAATGLQEMPQLCADGAGGVIVTWEDGRGANFDIYAQRLNGAGVPQWTLNGVAVNTAVSDQYSPVIAADGAGGAVIAWTDYRAGSTSDIWCQRLNASGARLWFANGNSIVNAAGDQDSPAVVSDGTGGFFAVWVDRRNTANYDLYYRRVLASGFPQGPINGLPLCVAAGDQLNPAIAADGLGGAIMTWADNRQTNIDIYAQRINAAGATLWSANGDSVCGAVHDQQYPTLVGDGAGGAFIAWEDARDIVEDLYAQHMDSTGHRAWAPNGAVMCVAGGAQTSPQLVRDAQGGVIGAWQDARSGSYDIYAQRMSAGGVPQWGNSGLAVCTASDQQVYPVAVTDGQGGAIVAWEDNRALENDIYAQRVLPGGLLGSPEPFITSVSDVPNDSGGSLSVAWASSSFDGGSSALAARYLVWRRALNGAWSVADSLPADGSPAYVRQEASIADSVRGTLTPRTAFRISALDANGLTLASSPADSGISLDNSLPAMPRSLSATLVDGVVHLSWVANTEPDLKGYHVYAGFGSTFALDASSLRGDLPGSATTWSGAPAGSSAYKVTAVDTHGNESDAAFAQPEATLGVGGAFTTWFAAPAPNPSRGALAFRFGLARESRVDLGVFDERGRRVRRLEAGMLAAGEHSVLWDGRDDGGHDAAPGVYFVRTRLEGREFAQRLVRVQ